MRGATRVAKKIQNTPKSTGLWCSLGGQSLETPISTSDKILAFKKTARKVRRLFK
jgi:hypothetical protein